MLWRGTPFGEFSDHPHFAGTVARLRELRLHARQRRGALLVAAGRPEEAAAALEGLVRDEPLREPAWIALLEALTAAGHQADAAAAARRYREHVREVGLDPSPRFLAAEREVFSGPETPAAGTADAPAPGSLPAPLVPPVGRDAELERLRDLLGQRRIVTLVGPGGVGKTTLGIAAARTAVGDFPGGAWIARLADVTDPDDVVPSIARAVGAPTTEPIERALCEFLAGRPLGVPGEVVVEVEPLEPDAAVELLEARARDAGAPIHPDQRELAAEVCARLDRLPLAIEMAAGRLRGLPLPDLAARLDRRLRLLTSDDDQADRHRTLHEVVAWSYELLDGPDRSLLAQLSLFAGPFDLDAAEAVCAIDRDVAAGLADVGTWADATLPTTRQADHELLPVVTAGVALNRLHRGETRGVAELLAGLPDAPPARHGQLVLGDLHTYMGELVAAEDRFRRAAALAERAGDRLTALVATASRALVVSYAGATEAALGVLDEARPAASQLGSDLATAWLDYAEGEVRAEQEPGRALELLDRAVTAADRGGWRFLAGVGRVTASSVRVRIGDPAEALPAFDRLIRHWDEIGDAPHQWTTLRNLVVLLARTGDADTAARLLGAASVASKPTHGREQDRLGDAETALRDVMGSGAFERAHEAGRRLSLDQAVDLALETLTGTEPVPGEGDHA